MQDKYYTAIPLYQGESELFNLTWLSTKPTTWHLVFQSLAKCSNEHHCLSSLFAGGCRPTLLRLYISTVLLKAQIVLCVL